MNESKKQSSFRFENFRVLRSELNFGSITNSDFSIEISPSGTFDISTKVYTLVLDVRVKDKLGNIIISVITESKFIFDEFDGEIPGFFTLNAPAITFPYIRAYISSLSSLSGIGTINLPILNLVDLIERLKSNLKIVDSPSG